jgi:hypothetical protein
MADANTTGHGATDRYRVIFVLPRYGDGSSKPPGSSKTRVKSLPVCHVHYSRGSPKR